MQPGSTIYWHAVRARAVTGTVNSDEVTRNEGSTPAGVLCYDATEDRCALRAAGHRRA
eukprot:SAG31_NODE_3657_length_4018_cov_1.668538_5_plen_58_part_00